MINLSKYAQRNDFNENVLEIAFNNMEFNINKSTEVFLRIARCLYRMYGRTGLSFNSTPALHQQFCHSCCHALAEHLVYVIHGQEGFKVAHIQIIFSVSIHSCVEIIWKGKTFFMDAGGISSSLEQVLERYKTDVININSVTVVRREGTDIVDDCDSREIRELTELTNFWPTISDIAENEGFDSVGDLEENAMNNIALAILLDQ
jgi:hypothetical protein